MTMVTLQKTSSLLQPMMHRAIYRSSNLNPNRINWRQPTLLFIGSDSTSFQTLQSRPFTKGIFNKISNFFRVIFGANETSPRGIQERQDSYLILLSLQCRDLRIEHQKAIGNSIGWKKESKEQVAAFMDEAADILDQGDSGIHGLSLAKLRKEVQKRLDPQILDRLCVASFADEEFGASDEYDFDEQRVDEYKDIMWRDYEEVCGKMKECEQMAIDERINSRRKFYELKKTGIERLLSYYDWWPQHHIAERKDEAKLNDGEEDEFGFCPSRSTPDIIPAMRHHHAKNLIRSYFARHNNLLHNEQFAILPFKSTIPNAGRGVFLDGYAPAGTLLAFFPGKIWPKDHLMSASLQTQMSLSDNDPRHQLSIRYDDILIDSRRSPYTVYDNLWALAHVVNHPPAPQKAENESVSNASDAPTKQIQVGGPNCAIVPINFTTNMLNRVPDRDLKRYIPNEYEVQPKPWAKNAFDTDDVIMNGLGLVSLRDVHDEELYYDYRLSPDESGSSAFPGWYYVWNEDATRNRWSFDE
jgi:hypothetical protein